MSGTETGEDMTPRTVSQDDPTEDGADQHENTGEQSRSPSDYRDTILSEHLKLLRSERGHAKGQVTRKIKGLYTLIEELDEPDIELVRARLVMLEKALCSFDTVCGMYECKVEETLELDAAYRYSRSVHEEYERCVQECRAWLHGCDRETVPEVHRRSELHSSQTYGERVGEDKDFIRLFSETLSQNRIMAEALQLPKVELITFDGSPLNYWSFRLMFDNSVGKSSLADHTKLGILMQHCTGKARKVIECCAAMDPSIGYTKALKLLKQRFGNEFVISEAWVDQVTCGPHIKPNDRKELQAFADDLRSCMETLRAMGRSSEVDTRRSLVRIVERLPQFLQHRWRKHAVEVLDKTDNYPGIKDLVKFVDMAAREANDPVFGTVSSDRQRDSQRRTVPDERPQRGRLSGTNFSTSLQRHEQPNTPDTYQSGVYNANRHSQNGPDCWLCPQKHSLFACDAFKAMKPEDRLNFTRGKGLCDNCLGSGHFAVKCDLARRCSVPNCGKKHTKFLHVVPRQTGRAEYVNMHSVTHDNSNTGHAHSGYVNMKDTRVHGAGTSVNGAGKDTTGSSRQRTVLPVVAVKVTTEDGNKSFDTFALLDSGSTNTFCSKRLCDQLDILGSEARLTLTTLDKKQSTTTTQVVSLEVSGIEEYDRVKLPFVYVRENLPIPSDSVADQTEIDTWPHLRGISIPYVGSREVELLIGQDIPEALAPLEIKRGGSREPYAMRTCLGWALNGPMGMAGCHRAICNFVSSDAQLEDQVAKFWKVENSEIDDIRQMSVNDHKVVSKWTASVTKSEGHYELPVPFKSDPPCLEYNIAVAERRLQQLGKRFANDRHLFAKYSCGITELVDKGYAERVPEEETNGPEGRTWYLPHHPVLNKKKPEKMRIVFDCAARFKGESLNDKVHQGPDLGNSLVGVLIRFRQERVAITSDIEAMFHQVKVTPDDRDALRFLWWRDGDPNKPLEIFRMAVHLFGGVWSPSCCTFALRQAALDGQGHFHEETIKTVLRNFYVDDCLRSVPSVPEALQLTSELRTLLSRAGFNLTKWLSNERQVIESIPVEARAEPVKELELRCQDLPKERALGVLWQIESDTLTYNINQMNKEVTRRGILSMISSVYDPLGLASPFLLSGKLILQELCRQKMDWDEQIPYDQQLKWSAWIRDLPRLEQLDFDRCYKPRHFGETKQCELHHFADASLLGHGTASYIRMVNFDDRVHCSLLIAKSKLNPLKVMTIPRLELSAAVVAVKVDQLIRRELELDIQDSVFWTDSMLVLQYIRNESSRFHTFVSNRVATIHSCSAPEQWRYVESSRNPADDASRGLSADELVQNQRWKHGPQFLWSDETNWPEQPSLVTELSACDVEVKSKDVVCSTTIEVSPDCLDHLFTEYSSWYKLKRIVTYILRMKQILFLKATDKSQSVDLRARLTVSELKDSELAIIRYIQQTSYGTEIKALQTGKNLSKSDKLYYLEPFLNGHGVLCVGGRLSNAPIREESKHQMILPKSHHVTALIIRYYHDLSGHAGREYVLASIRSRFWIIKGSSAVSSELRKCVQCKRRKAPFCSQQMADLPVDRVTPGKPPFTYVGVDCFGPFLVKRGRSEEKRYGCLFTCLTVRAIHLEILHSLNTDSFLNGLQRFIARRGKPDKIRSDNGTNFTSGERELRQSIRDWNQAQIGEFLLQRDIQWEFNPPAASHMGGIWERQIRTVRKVLSAVLKEQTLTDEGLSTILCVVEAIVNGRPLTTVSNSHEDFEPLTPNHLLLLRGGDTLPPGVFVKEDIHRRRWRQIQYLADVFWRRWLKEYLPTLQLRQKWLQAHGNLKPDDVVLVADATTPRNLWPLGRVVEVFPGKDGLVRSVRVKTRATVLTRPIDKLCLLESVDD